MENTNILSGIVTVVFFATFIGIVVWAYSRKRRKSFEDAANAPFALPDDEAAGTRTESREGSAP